VKSISSATPRTRTLASRDPVPDGRLLSPGQTVQSPESFLRYRVERFLGQGGFGQVYLARRLDRSTDVAETVCIKVSGRIDGWLREAYFGQLLAGHARAIRIYDAFPLTLPGGRLVYALAIEYARFGDLRAFLRLKEKGWPERTVRREIAGILEVLRKLHRGQMLHRDLTPMNVFVCDGPSLKLGDFGIVRQQSDASGITARTMNMLTAPSDILAGMVPKWQARDDVYQMGQLLGMLVKWDASARLRTAEIRRLRCGDHLKEIIHRCLGERRKRYDNADDLIEALRNPPAPLRSGVLRSLRGVHLAFTGILSRQRREAVRAARRAGAKVHGGPSIKTTVVVRGRPNPLQAAGREAGLKLMEIRRLRAKGHRITILDERQFWRLAGKL
jgi:serine/threonine protein kinase